MKRIEKSSKSNDESHARWYKHHGPAYPNISLVDYGSQKCDEYTLYAGCSTKNYNKAIKLNDGADVYVRFKEDYEY